MRVCVTQIVGQNEDQEEEEEEEEEVEDGLLDIVPWLSYSFPFAPNVGHVSQRLRSEIIGSLPEPKEAGELAAFYFQYAAWMLVNPVYTPLQTLTAGRYVYSGTRP